MASDAREGFRVAPDATETDSQRLDRVEAQLPQPPFNLDAAFESAAQSLEAQRDPLKAASGQQWGLGAAIPGLPDIPGAIGSGAAKALVETKDFLLGQPAEADKWDFRRFIEGQSEARRKDSAAYGITESISQFAAGMVGFGKVAGAVTKVAPKVGAAAEAIKGSSKFAAGAAESAKAAAVGSIVFDPHDERMSNLIEQVPELSNPITRYLQASPEDGAAEGRLKSAIENIGLDAAIGSALFLGAKAYRAFKTGDVVAGEAATKELETVQRAGASGDAVAPPQGLSREEWFKDIPEDFTPQEWEAERQRLLKSAEMDSRGLAIGRTDRPIGVAQGSGWMEMPSNNNVDPTSFDAVRLREAEKRSLEFEKLWKKAEEEDNWSQLLPSFRDRQKAMDIIQADRFGGPIPDGLTGDAGEDLHRLWLGENPLMQEAANILRDPGTVDYVHHHVDTTNPNPTMGRDSMGSTMLSAGNDNAPKTVGEFFDLGTAKRMDEATGAPTSESISGEAPKPTIDVVQSKTAGLKGSKAEAPSPLVPHPEDTQLVLDNIKADAEALKTYGSREAAEDAGYTFSQSNIPWQKINAPDELQAFIGNMADAMKPELDAMKGGEVMSDVEVQARVNRLANAYGQDPQAVIGSLASAGDAAASMVAKMEAADAIATKMAQEAYQVARKIQSGNIGEWGGDRVAAMAEFSKRVGIAMTTFGSARSMLSNSARTLRRARGDLERLSFGEISKIRNLDPEDLLRIFSTAAGDTNAMREALVRPSLWQHAGNFAGHLLVNNLLWSWKTFTVNLLGNTIMLALRPVEKAIGASTLRAASFLGFEVPGASEVAKRANYEMLATASEIKDTLFHLLESDTGKATWQALKSYESVIDPNMVEASRIGAQTRPDFRPIEGVGDLLHDAYAGFWHLTGIPTRLMGAADELSKQIRYRSFVVAEARAQADELGLGAAEAGEHVKRALSEAFDEAGRATNTKALQESRVATFQQELIRENAGDRTWGGLPSAGSVVQDATSRLPLLRGVLPFVKTPANVLRMGIQYTPGLNLLQREYATAISGAKGAEAQAQAIGQMVVGSLIGATIYTMALEGKITGGGPSNPKLRAEMISKGWQPYSRVTIGEDGKPAYFPLFRFDPIALPIGIVADMVDIFQHPERADAHQEGLALAVALSLAKNVTSRTYLQSLQTFFQAVADPDRSLGKFAGHLAGNMVPFASATRAYGPDPYMHEVRGVVDGIMANTWGLSETLPPKRDAFGTPILVNRGFWSSTKDNIVDNEVLRLGIEAGVGVSAPSPIHKGVDLRDLTLEDGRNAYDAFQVLAAKPAPGVRSLKDAAAKLIASRAYQRMSDGDGSTSGTKSAALRDLLAKYRDGAIKSLMKTSPVLREALSAAQRKAAAAYAEGAKPAGAVGDAKKLEGLLSSFGVQVPQGQ